MTKEEALKLAKEFSIKNWNFDIVRYAGEEDGWHYFSCTRAGRPHYSSLPRALRVNAKGELEEVRGNARQMVNAMAYKLKIQSEN